MRKFWFLFKKITKTNYTIINNLVVLKFSLLETPFRTIDWLIDFKGMSTRLGLVYV